MTRKWYVGIPVVLLAMTVTVAASAQALRIIRYMIALLLAFTVGMVVTVGPALAQDGPSVCHYHDGTLLNVGGWPGGCPPQPYWPQRN
jgi:hypothetical protein